MGRHVHPEDAHDADQPSRLPEYPAQDCRHLRDRGLRDRRDRLPADERRPPLRFNAEGAGGVSFLQNKERTSRRPLFGKSSAPHLRNYDCPPQQLLIRWEPHLYLNTIIP